MPLITLASRARALWESLSGVPLTFERVVRVEVSPQSRLCPAGWAGLVAIEDAAIGTAPDPSTARIVEHALSAVPAASVTDAELLRGKLNIADLLGPATLAYLDQASFRSQQGAAVIEQVDACDSMLRRFLARADAEDLSESGMGQITSPAFAVYEHREIIAAAGYRDWPAGSHICAC